MALDEYDGLAGPVPVAAGPAPIFLPERSLRVLLAEDHPTNQRVVQLILASAGAEVVTVENGALSTQVTYRD